MKAENSHILELNNLSIGYQKPLLTGINTQIEKGEVVLLIGKNGSGKTTLLKTIFKELAPISGSIKISTIDLSKVAISEIGKLISVVLSQSSISPSLKVFDLIALGRYPYKKWYQTLTQKEVSDIMDIMDLLELTPYKEYYINKLSDGNLQKALIARALIQDCPLLILDEPTSHLDVSNKLEIINTLSYLAKEKGKTILFTSHDLTIGLSIADRLWLIKDNELKAGYTEDLANTENILNHFAGKSLEFNYLSNEYRFANYCTKGNVQVLGNSKAIYWLKKALAKNQFSITDNADLVIAENESGYLIKNKGNTQSTFSIQETINFINSLSV